MMLTSVVVLSIFAIAIAFLFGALWHQRQAADERAARNAERAAEVDALHSVAHDLDNIFGTLIGNASTAYDMTPQELAEVCASFEAASRNGRRMIRALRGSVGTPSEQSVETTLRVIANMHRRCGANVELNVESDLKFTGQPDQAFRIIYNLLGNAAREIAGMPGAVVRAHLSSTELRITNPLRAGAVVDERIFDRGFSSHCSSGLGLHVVREVARAIDLHVSYELGGGEVTFVVSTDPKSATRAKFAGHAAARSETR